MQMIHPFGNPKIWSYLVLPILTAMLALSAIAMAEDALSTKQIESRLRALQSAVKEDQEQYEEQFRSIEKLETDIIQEKRKRSGRPGRKLSKMLRKAQEHTLNAETLRQRLDTLQLEVAHYREQLRRRYSAQLRELLQRLEETTVEKQRSTLIQRLVKTLDTWDKLQGSQPSAEFAATVLPASRPELSVDETDEPTVILAKSDLARDHADWLRARAYQVEVRIGRMQSEQELRSRLGAFADEIALFDSGPTVRVLPREEREVLPDDKPLILDSTGPQPPASGDKRLALDAVEPPTEIQVPPVESVEAEIDWVSPPDIDRMDLASQIARLHKYQAQLSARAKEYETLAQGLQQQAQQILNAESQRNR